MEIKYVGFYDHISNQTQARNYALPATSKMEYIAQALSRLGNEVLIVSPSSTTKSEPFPGHVREVMPGVRVKLFPTLRSGNKLRRVASVLYSRFSLLKYLLTQTSPGEPVIIYHSLAIQEIVLIAKKFRRFSLILEVEEIYQDVVEARWWKRRAEYRLFSKADALILSTELLAGALDRKNRPMAVVYGDYRSPDLEALNQERVPGRIVYAGTFDPRKGGAAAAAAAAYLDDSFEVNILGFGSAEDIATMKQLVQDVDSAGGASVRYHGTLVGREYAQFLASCEIGLATQDPSAKFNHTSFPSKILSYLGHGLKVVSVRIPAVEDSGVGGQLTFYDVQEPREIAEAVKRAARQKREPGQRVLKGLDKGFTEQLRWLLKELSN